ncbi:MAG: hypothetical protein J6Y18_05365 [Candidatus Methanomethylophilaceae archaeon]|nr:hypothetical protein [Candidatus Methanomethylophilaceae archaeon]
MTQDQEFIPSVAVGRFSGDLGGMSADEANRLLIGLLSKISVDCSEAGGIIGHNKANFRCGEDLLSISCTTDNGNVRTKTEFSSPVGKFTGVMDVIVYDLGYSAMKEIVERRTSEIDGCNVTVLENQNRCSDPNCKDPNCTNPDHMAGRQ